jgi:hypothetical protein
VRRLGLVATAAVLSIMVIVQVSAAASKSGVIGSWSSSDPGDGSAQHLYVTGGTGLNIKYVDDFGSVCVRIGAPTVVFTGRLTGYADGDALFAWFKQGGCGPVQEINASMRIGWTFQYDSATDTLYGPFEDGPTTWSRD